MGPYSALVPLHPLNFPTNFNPHAVYIWFAVCQQLKEDEKDGKVRSAWKNAIPMYMEACASAGLEPFCKGEIDSNVAIRNYLYRQRVAFVQFLNVTGLMHDIPVIRALQREAQIEPYGFSITVSAQVRREDPTWTEALFKSKAGYRFSRLRVSGKYIAQINPGLVVFVYNEGTRAMNRWHIGYRISCPIAPVNQDEDEQDFILRELWQPLMAEFRARRAAELEKVRHL